MSGISLDLRERIVEAYEQKEGSMRCIGKRFKVGKNTVLRLTNNTFAKLKYICKRRNRVDSP